MKRFHDNECTRIELIPNKLLFIKKKDKIHHLFFWSDSAEKFHLKFANFRFMIHWCKYNPKKSRLHIQIWLPFIHISRNNSELIIGNRYQIIHFH